MNKSKDLISFLDLDKEDVWDIFQRTYVLKSSLKKGTSTERPLRGKTLGMIFEKPSTRTSISFAVGMYQLGGLPLILSAQDLQLHRGESVSDTARVLSRYVDIIMIRANKHQSIVDMAACADVPVINGLTDREHPCQILADLYTIIEKKYMHGASMDWNNISLDGIKITYVGDGNNIANTFILAASILGFKLIIASPPGYEPDKEIFDRGRKYAVIEHDPVKAVKHADVIYTDVWTSMGREKEKDIRKNVFKSYQVNSSLVAGAANNQVLVMHCMPAHRGYEITDEVIDSDRSIVFDQAENRLHVQKAIIMKLLKR